MVASNRRGRCDSNNSEYERLERLVRPVKVEEEEEVIGRNLAPLVNNRHVVAAAVELDRIHQEEEGS